MAISHRFDLAGFLSEFVDAHRGVRLGRMFGLPAAFAGRRMFACVYEDALCCRLPPDIAARELRRHARPFEPDVRGVRRPRRGWVSFRPRDRAELNRLVPTLELGARHVAESGGEPRLRTPRRRPSPSG